MCIRDSEETAPLLWEGADDFLNALAALWDVLDASLLQSGYRVEEPSRAKAAVQRPALIAD